MFVCTFCTQTYLNLKYALPFLPTPHPPSISTERHRAEVRRAVNDERLTTIAYQ